MFPDLERPAFYASSATPVADSAYTVEFENTTMEFRGAQVDVFSAYYQRGRRLIYRREYISVKLNPVVEEWAEYSGPTVGNKFTTFGSQKWQSFTWANSSQLRVNSTTSNNVTVQLIFEFFNATSDSPSAKIKFSFLVFSTSRVLWSPCPLTALFCKMRDTLGKTRAKETILSECTFPTPSPTS